MSPLGQWAADFVKLWRVWFSQCDHTVCRLGYNWEELISSDRCSILNTATIQNYIYRYIGTDWVVPWPLPAHTVMDILAVWSCSQQHDTKSRIPQSTSASFTLNSTTRLAFGTFLNFVLQQTMTLQCMLDSQLIVIATPSETNYYNTIRSNNLKEQENKLMLSVFCLLIIATGVHEAVFIAVAWNEAIPTKLPGSRWYTLLLTTSNCWVNHRVPIR